MIQYVNEVAEATKSHPPLFDVFDSERHIETQTHGFLVAVALHINEVDKVWACYTKFATTYRARYHRNHTRKEWLRHAKKAGIYNGIDPHDKD